MLNWSTPASASSCSLAMWSSTRRRGRRSGRSPRRPRRRRCSSRPRRGAGSRSPRGRGRSRSATPGSCSRGYLLTRSTTWLLTSAGNQRVRSRHSSRGATCAGAAAWTLTLRRAAGGASASRSWSTNQRIRSGSASCRISAVGDAAGHRERLRSVAGDPDRQVPVGRSRAVQLGALVVDGSALDQVADDPDRLFQRLHAWSAACQHPPRASRRGRCPGPSGPRSARRASPGRWRSRSARASPGW